MYKNTAHNYYWRQIAGDATFDQTHWHRTQFGSSAQRGTAANKERNNREKSNGTMRGKCQWTRGDRWFIYIKCTAWVYYCTCTTHAAAVYTHRLVQCFLCETWNDNPPDMRTSEMKFALATARTTSKNGKKAASFQFECGIFPIKASLEPNRLPVRSLFNKFYTPPLPLGAFSSFKRAQFETRTPNPID